jgi:hypothetical protein
MTAFGSKVTFPIGSALIVTKCNVDVSTLRIAADA